MAAVATTLPLYWNLASASKKERLDASVKLVSALQQFQSNYIPEAAPESESEKNTDDEEEGATSLESEYKTYLKKLQAENAADVAYAVQRLVRGLGSPRESSRLGFAVALTELLSRLDTISCEQILVLIRNSSQITGSMSGQEERDMLFARLFGLKAVVQSGILFRQVPLKSSSTSSGSFKAFEIFLTELLSLAEKKSWLRESCWWTLLSVVNALESSEVEWKDEAFSVLLDRIFVSDKSWSPEKVSLTLKLRKSNPNADWQTFCGSYFKNPDLLSTTNLPLLGRLLKESLAEESETDNTKSGSPWKPQLHFSWDIILDNLLSPDEPSTSSKNFQDFYRIVVDENLFASSSSPQRKYWGFLVFQKALHRLPSAYLPMLFTKNFMRTWINQLSKKDRFLHKIARQVTNDVQAIVEKDPQTGFTLVLQLTGTNGSFHFDRITKTKTVENILANMDGNGINAYVNYLLKQVNEGESDDSFSSIDARRSWVIDQMTCLIRRNSIPRTDESVGLILAWFATNGFFTVIKKSPKSSNVALHTIPEPPFSHDLQRTCRSKLLTCVADLSAIPPNSDNDNAKGTKATGVSADGEPWLSKVLKTLTDLENDSKHVKSVYDLDEEVKKTRDNAFAFSKKLNVSADENEVARGVEILINTLLLKCLCEYSDGNSETDWETLDDCLEASTRLLAPVKSGKKAANKEKKKEPKEDVQEPIDLLVDIIIGLLEQSSSFSRTMANHSFTMMTSKVIDSTVDLILTQLERRDPTDEVDEEAMDESEDDEDNEEDNEDEENSNVDEDADFSEADDEEAEALRKALQSAISEKEEDVDEDASSEASMDDEQMMAIDEKLAAVFKTRAEERKKGKDVGAQREATYFKNRVLDLVDIYLKKQLSNPLALRFVLPLVELISTASTDEKQLSDKTKGILRSRLGKSKESVPLSDPTNTINLLESLHQRARKASSSELVAVISMCCTFVSRSLITVDEQAVIRIYSESISDFILRKASALNPAFLLDFIRRYPSQSWNFLGIILQSVKESANGYRQCQAFHVLQTIFTSFSHADSRKDEILSAISLVSDVFVDVITNLCSSEKPLMTAAQLKDTLKVGLQLCRYSKRISPDLDSVKRAWPPKKWDTLASKLASSEHFKSSTSLSTTCQQISKIAQASAGVNNTKGSTAATPSSNQEKSVRKRKQEDVGNESSVANDNSTRKPKRKKVRKDPKRD